MTIFTVGLYQISASVEENGHLTVCVSTADGSSVTDLDTSFAAIKAASDVSEVKTRRYMAQGAGAAQTSSLVPQLAEEGVGKPGVTTLLTMQRLVCFQQQVVLLSDASLTRAQINALYPKFLKGIGTAEMVDIGQVEWARTDVEMHPIEEPAVHTVHVNGETITADWLLDE